MHEIKRNSAKQKNGRIKKALAHFGYLQLNFFYRASEFHISQNSSEKESQTLFSGYTTGMKYLLIFFSPTSPLFGVDEIKFN
jgi:hypothetical protein